MLVDAPDGIAHAAAVVVNDDVVVFAADTAMARQVQLAYA